MASESFTTLDDMRDESSTAMMSFHVTLVLFFNQNASISLQHLTESLGKFDPIAARRPSGITSKTPIAFQSAA